MRINRPSAATLALIPAWFIALGLFLGAASWIVILSFTRSRQVPGTDWIGLAQYRRLWSAPRWIVSMEHFFVYGAMFIVGALLMGTLLAISFDRRVRGEAFFRVIFLYPYATSFIVTGLIWQWLMNPLSGIGPMLAQLGISGIDFAWATDRNMALYAVAGAAIWHASGLVMVLLLSALRGVSEEIWMAARLDGIPVWRVYTAIVLPMIGSAFATASVLLLISVVKTFDLVIALTGGGPGTASEVPAKFIMDSLFERQNIGLAAAASTIMLLITTAAVASLKLHARWAARQRGTL